MKLHKKTLLAIVLGTGPIHLAGCATMMEDNPELACAMMGVAGGLVGYAIGDDTGAAIAGAAIGTLGCALIQHLGAEDAKAVEDWQRTQLSGASLDKAHSFAGKLPSSDGETMLTPVLNIEAAKPFGQHQEWSDKLGEHPSWLTEDTPCRQQTLGVEISTKELRRDAFECVNEEGDMVEVAAGAFTPIQA